MNSPRKSHVKRLFLNTLEDLKPRKEWTHPGSPMWTDCSWTLWEDLEPKEGMNSPRKSHVNRLFLNTWDDLKPRKEWTHPGSPMWRDCSWTLCKTWSQGRNELTQEVPCEQIVPQHPWGWKRLNTLEDLNPKREWTHPGSPMWTDCFWTLWRTWSQGRNELTQEVPCEQIVSEHSGRLEAKEGMNSPRKSHVNRLFLNTLEDLKPRKEWTHPGSPMWTEVVSEHSGGFEAKEGMNSPRKSHVNRLFLNTWDDLKPRKEWTHPGSPMWRDCFWTPWRTWTHGRNELTQEVPCEEVVSEHMRWLEAKEGMNSPRKSHVKRLFLNTLEDLNPWKEWTHPGSPMWRSCFWTHEMTWSKGRNKLTQEVPCEQIVS